jgi:hypothetical protein
MANMGNRFRILFLGLFLSLVFSPLTGYGFTLITLQEATQPEPSSLFGVKCSRLEEGGPQIKISSPKPDEPLIAPFVVDVSFEAPPGKTIDYGSLRLRYLKLIPIDLTDRVKGYLTQNRLLLKDVNVPQGQHCLQLLIAYTTGEETLMEIFLQVIK